LLARAPPSALALECRQASELPAFASACFRIGKAAQIVGLDIATVGNDGCGDSSKKGEARRLRPFGR